MLFFGAGIVLVFTGGLVTVAFWIPRLIDRQRLKELLGTRYILVYLIYSANGPILLLAGVVLLLKHYKII